MFRLRLSNNIPELTNSSTQKMSNRNQTPLRINSNLQKSNMNNNNNNINKISSSFNTYTMNSKANSLSTTPDKLLPMIMMKKIKNSKKSNASNSTKISRYSSDLSDDTNPDSSSVENCDCILCATDLARKTKRKIAQPNEMYLVDSKNFVNCLNALKPTIKYDRENNQFSDVNYVGSSQQINSDFNSLKSESTLIKIKNNNQVIKLIPANSRIKLWDSNEVTNYIDSNRRASTEMKKVSKNQLKTEVITTNNNTVSDRQSRLAKIFKEFRINPNLTPLIYRNSLVTSIGFQENTTVPIIKNMPITSVTTRTTPTNVYRVSDKNSLTFICDTNIDF